MESYAASAFPNSDIPQTQCVIKICYDSIHPSHFSYYMMYNASNAQGRLDTGLSFASYNKPVMTFKRLYFIQLSRFLSSASILELFKL